MKHYHLGGLLCAAAMILVLAVTGCGRGGGKAATGASQVPPSAPASPSAHHHVKHHQVSQHRRQAAAHRSGCGAAALWRHIYHPDRLRVVRQCMTVRGIVKEVRLEPDGDLHMLLATRASLVNSANNEYVHGDLVLEEICLVDAVAACQNVPRHPTIPTIGDKVTVTGSYVLDKNQGWMEIHPVTSLTITGTAPIAQDCYPKASSGNCYEPGEFCPHADAGMTGVAGDGKTITCELVGGYYRWED
jgi:hypothetical protein